MIVKKMMKIGLHLEIDAIKNVLLKPKKLIIFVILFVQEIFLSK